MIDTLVAMYKKGAITADHLVVQCLQMIDPKDPGLVLDSLPPGILSRMMHYACDYQPTRMLTNYGPAPAIDQVEAAKDWIASMVGAEDATPVGLLHASDESR